ncbi:MAG: hypothetical protein AWM53_00371 [Candidatus Dichloromethanomonas elyunquensis]|nr:MAG: hypothetical protein AWM53_00371 [Candidatus Dichloromethanomonas elyunquensis]
MTSLRRKWKEIYGIQKNILYIETVSGKFDIRSV